MKQAAGMRKGAYKPGIDSYTNAPCFSFVWPIVYAIHFADRYFRDLRLHVGGEIRDGLILQFGGCFHYYK